MGSNSVVNQRKQRRLLSPAQKYELYVSVLTGQQTQREAAQKWKIDRTTVITICRTAKEGALEALSARPGPSGQDARAGGAGRGPRGGGAAAGHGGRVGDEPASAREKSQLGLMGGPVPPRVDGDVKAGLLALIDHALEVGWSTRRACDLLGLDHMRAARWAARRDAGRLADAPPGGNPIHGLLD